MFIRIIIIPQLILFLYCNLHADNQDLHDSTASSFSILFSNSDSLLSSEGHYSIDFTDSTITDIPVECMHWFPYLLGHNYFEQLCEFFKTFQEVTGIPQRKFIIILFWRNNRIINVINIKSCEQVRKFLYGLKQRMNSNYFSLRHDWLNSIIECKDLKQDLEKDFKEFIF